MNRGNSKTKASRGRPSWAKGSKLDFLEGFSTEFFKARNGGHDEAGRFYERVTNAYFCKYGFDPSLDEDVAGTPPREDVVVEPMNFDGLEDKEVQRRTALVKKMRKMIGQWYRHRYTNTRAAAVNEGINYVLQGMREVSKARPRKPIAINAYSNKYYQTHLKQAFNAKWENLKPMLPKSARIGMVREFIRESWDKETQEFREDFQKEIDDAYAIELAAWKNGLEAQAPRTPRDYHEAMQNSSTVVVPFADALAQHLGMHIAVLMVGPLEDGEIGLRSVFSSIEDTKVSDIWPRQDRATFTLVEKSLKEYGKQLFTADECQQRRYDPDDEDSACPSVEMDGIGDIQGDNGTPATPTMQTSLSNAFTGATAGINEANNMGVGSSITSATHEPAGNMKMVLPCPSSTENEPRTSTACPSPAGSANMSHASSVSSDAVPPGPSSTESEPRTSTASSCLSPAVTANASHASSVSSTNVPPGPSSTESEPPTSTPCPSPVTANASHATSVPNASRATSVPNASHATSVPNASRATSVPNASHATSVPNVTVTTSENQRQLSTTGSSPATVATSCVGLAPSITTSATTIQGLPLTAANSTKGTREAPLALSTLINEVYKYLQCEEKSKWGNDWNLCVDSLLAFEGANGFPTKGSRMKTHLRPDEIAIWMRHARPWKDQDLSKDFPSRWWAWWNSLENSNDDIIPGPNGVLLVVISIAWWGASLSPAERASNDKDSWIKAVQQVTATLKVKTKCDVGTPRSKRKAGNDNGPKASKKSKF